MAYINFQPKDNFKTKLYDGNYTGGSSEQVFTDIGFANDLVWIKGRNATEKHIWTDTIRGATKTISCSTNTSESTDAEYLKAFSSSGFTIGASNETNENGKNFFAQCFKAGTTTGINQDSADITPSSYSFNQTAGFSIIKWAGNAGAGTTIPHGLGKKPDLIIIKNISTADRWQVYHSSLGATKFHELSDNGSVSTSSNRWNDTEPTATKFSTSTNGSVGGTPSLAENLIAYCFANTKGFFRAGCYTGTGSSSSPPFVATGFRPALVIQRRIDATCNWYIGDSKRVGYNPDNNASYADIGNVEGTFDWIDLYANGFRMAGTDTSHNYSGGSYIYMAWAEFPFVSSNGIAGVAR